MRRRARTSNHLTAESAGQRRNTYWRTCAARSALKGMTHRIFNRRLSGHKEAGWPGHAPGSHRCRELTDKSTDRCARGKPDARQAVRLIAHPREGANMPLALSTTNVVPAERRTQLECKNLWEMMDQRRVRHPNPTPSEAAHR